MANKLQKFLFNLSTVSPLVICMAIVWWLQCGKDEMMPNNSTVHLTAKAIIISVVGIVGLMFSLYSVILVKLSRQAETVSINAASVKTKDGWIIGAIAAYLLPFACCAFEDFDLWFLSLVAIVALVVFLRTNTVLPNPVLILCGYHFYEISNDNGSEELPLISKRKSIQDAKSIKRVITLWDYFMIEVNE